MRLPRPADDAFGTWWELNDHIEDEDEARAAYEEYIRDAEEEWVARVA